MHVISLHRSLNTVHARGELFDILTRGNHVKALRRPPIIANGKTWVHFFVFPFGADPNRILGTVEPDFIDCRNLSSMTKNEEDFIFSRFRGKGLKTIILPNESIWQIRRE